MEGGKQVSCTFKIAFSKALMVAGLIGGLLLGILGIVTITADTSNLFKSPFVRFYTGDTYKITFTDKKPLSNQKIWLRPQDQINFAWECEDERYVMLCDKDRTVLSGFHTAHAKNGDVLVSVANLTTGMSHYYCVNNRWSGTGCSWEDGYRGEIAMYDGSLFQTNGQLGNQNTRFTFFLLAVVTIAFGIIIILGELHVPLITTKFTFFYYSFVKGIIYIAYGFLVMGMSNLFGLFVAIFMWILGVANCIYGWKSLTTFHWKSIGGRGTTTIVTRREYI